MYQIINVEPGNGTPVYSYSFDSVFVLKNISRGDTLSYILSNRTANSKNTDTLTLIDSTNHPLNICKNSFANIWSTPFSDRRGIQRWDTLNLYLKVQVEDNNNGDSIKFIEGSTTYKGDFYKDSLGNKILYQRDMETLEGVDMRQEYQEGLGKTLDVFTLFEGQISRQLIQLIRNGDTLVNIKTASFQSLKAANSITIYPNPTSTLLHIEASSPIHSVKLFDTNGKMVLSVNETKSMYIGSLLPGIYIAEITSNQGIIRKKVYKK